MLQTAIWSPCIDPRFWNPAPRLELNSGIWRFSISGRGGRPPLPDPRFIFPSSQILPRGIKECRLLPFMPPISHHQSHQFFHTSTPFSSVLVLQQSSQYDSPPCLQRNGTRKLPRKIIHPTNGPQSVKTIRSRSQRWILLRRLNLVLQRWIDMPQQRIYVLQQRLVFRRFISADCPATLFRTIRRTQNYSMGDLEALLNAIEEVRPIGLEKCERVLILELHCMGVAN